jgi:hypothetical protein
MHIAYKLADKLIVEPLSCIAFDLIAVVADSWNCFVIDSAVVTDVIGADNDPSRFIATPRTLPAPDAGYTLIAVILYTPAGSVSVHKSVHDANVLGTSTVAD